MKLYHSCAMDIGPLSSLKKLQELIFQPSLMKYVEATICVSFILQQYN